MTNHKFYRNFIAFCIGLILFGTDLFSQIPSLDRVGVTFIGGYLSLSLYHAWMFGAERMGNMYSSFIFWLMPVIFVFSIAFCLLYGCIVSLPRFLYSFYIWVRNNQSIRNKPVTLHPLASNITEFPNQPRSIRSKVTYINYR